MLHVIWPRRTPSRRRFVKITLGVSVWPQLRKPGSYSLFLLGAQGQGQGTLSRGESPTRAAALEQGFRFHDPGQRLLRRHQGGSDHSACAVRLTHAQVVLAEEIPGRHHGRVTLVRFVLEFQLQRSLVLPTRVTEATQARQHRRVLSMDVGRTVVRGVSVRKGLHVPLLGLGEALTLPKVERLRGEAKCGGLVRWGLQSSPRGGIALPNDSQHYQDEHDPVRRSADHEDAIS
jgi:hypothetical protein